MQYSYFSLAEQFQSAKLSVWNNQWFRVHDFNETDGEVHYRLATTVRTTARDASGVALTGSAQRQSGSDVLGRRASQACHVISDAEVDMSSPVPFTEGRKVQDVWFALVIDRAEQRAHDVLDVWLHEGACLLETRQGTLTKSQTGTATPVALSTIVYITPKGRPPVPPRRHRRQRPEAQGDVVNADRDAVRRHRQGAIGAGRHLRRRRPADRPVHVQLLLPAVPAHDINDHLRDTHCCLKRVRSTTSSCQVAGSPSPDICDEPTHSRRCCCCNTTTTEASIGSSASLVQGRVLP